MEYVEEALIDLSAYKKLRELVCRIFLLLANRASHNFVTIRERLPEGMTMLPFMQRVFKGQFNYIATCWTNGTGPSSSFALFANCKDLVDATRVATKVLGDFIDLIPEYLWLADENMGRTYIGTYDRDGSVLRQLQT